jgi:hypothetical protein
MTTDLHKVVGVIDVSSMSLDDLRPEDLGLTDCGTGKNVDQSDCVGESSKQVATCRVRADVDQLVHELQGALQRYQQRAARSIRRTHPR